MKIVKAMPFLAMGTMALGLVGATVLAPVASADDQKTGADQTVQVEVGSNLSLSLTKGDGKVKGTLNGKESAQTEGTVTSNAAKGFTVTLKDKADDATMRLTTDSKKAGIPAKDGVNESTTEPGWSTVLHDETGVQKVVAMPGVNGTALHVYKTDGPKAEATKFNVGYTFKADNSIQNGTYSTEVTYTVAANS